MTSKKDKDSHLQQSNWVNKNAITYWEDIYVRVDRQFTNIDSKYHLTVEELYIFMLISMEQRKDRSVFICIHMISENMPIKLYKGKERNNREIVDSLLSLIYKGVIKVDGTIDHKEPLTPFYIRVNYEDIESDEKWVGFNQIGLHILQRIERIEHLYMYCTIKGFDRGFRYSYQEWGLLLNRSVSSIKRYVKEVVEEEYNLIEVNYGGYLEGSRTRQEKNTYKTSPFSEEEKTIQTKDKERERNKKARKQAFGERLP